MRPPDPIRKPAITGSNGGHDINGDTISNLDFIRMYLSGRITFPGEAERPFGYSDLQDIEPLGSGSYGSVRKMRHRHTEQMMAVKRVKLTCSGLDEDGINKSVMRLRLEVDAIRKSSDCEQIVQFFGVAFHEGDAWVCMELMDISLEHLYKTAKLLGHQIFDENTLGCIALSTTNALLHLKDNHHIIHRDVKPSNILLNAHGKVKLCDFGICGYLQDSVAQTMEVGCRPYMAPERLLSRNTYDIRSDVWSLGISMVEVANLEHPFPDFNSAPMFHQLQMVVYGDPPMVMNPAYSRRTREFINNCVIKEQKSRPTFQQLTDTEYFAYYSNLPGLEELVAEFVRPIIPAREEFKRTHIDKA